MVLVPFLATAGGMGGGGMGGGKHSSGTTYVVTNSRLGGSYGNLYSSPYRYTSAYPYSGYNYGSPSYGGFNSYNYGSPSYGGFNSYNYGSPYSYGGLNSWNFGQQQVVTGKEYTQEQSFTRYVPGGEITTTVGEDTETAIINPYSNQYNYGLGAGYLGNNYGYNNYPGYGFNTGYNNLYSNWY